MAFSSKNTVVMEKDSRVGIQAQGAEEDLTKSELEYLLSTLKNADLKGYQVEMFYNLIVKIQNQYIKKQ